MSGDGRIKIMHMVNHLTLTGMEYGVIKLLNNLSSDVYEKHICVLSKVYPGVAELVNPDIRIIELNRKPGFDTSILNPIRRYINEHKIDIIHSHNWATFPFAVLLKYLTRASYLIHGEHGRETVNWEMSKLQKIFIRLFRKSVTKYTAVAKHLADDIHTIWRVDNKNIIAVSNGIDLTKFGQYSNVNEFRKELEIPDNSHLLCTIAGFRPIKDHQTIFKAVGKLSEKIENVVLLVIGTSFDSGVADKLQKMALTNCGKAKTLFLGLRKDIPRVLNAIDVYINASIYEGMSNTILEAMASKCPVIASDNNGNKEILSDLKMNNLFKTGDHSDLATKLENALLNQQFKVELIQKQYEHVKTKYSNQNYVSGYDVIYKKISGK